MGDKQFYQLDIYVNYFDRTNSKLYMWSSNDRNMTTQDMISTAIYEGPF